MYCAMRPKSHLDACQQELKQLQKKLDTATEEAEEQRERNETAKKDFEKERAEMKSEIEELRGKKQKDNFGRI